MKPLKKSSVGLTSPVVVFLGPGAGDISRKCSKKAVTPKSANAEPKNTGVSSPAKINSLSFLSNNHLCQNLPYHCF